MEIGRHCEATYIGYSKSKTHVVGGATNVVFVDLLGLVATHYPAKPIIFYSKSKMKSLVGRCCSSKLQPRTQK